MPTLSLFPDLGRTAWILAQRPARGPDPDPNLPQGVFLERERLASGEIAASGVVLLTNRECPWRCLMCDLWQHTTRQSVPIGAIPRQLDHAVQRWSAAGPLPPQVKLYNSGSFFDPHAIPPEDYRDVARRVDFARNVVVESHPLLVGDRTVALRDLLKGTLEVAMGLETAHPEALEKLNKKFTLDQFARAADFLARQRVALRVFLLVHPPFVEAIALEWLGKSVRFAFDCGATAVTLIPTRAGNGAMDRLRASGEWSPPTLATLEEAQRAALAIATGRVFADTWGLEAVSECPACATERRRRIQEMNDTQQVASATRCDRCGSM